MCVTPIGPASSRSRQRSRLPLPLLVLLGGPVLLVVFGWAVLRDKLRALR